MRITGTFPVRNPVSVGDSPTLLRVLLHVITCDHSGPLASIQLAITNDIKRQCMNVKLYSYQGMQVVSTTRSLARVAHSITCSRGFPHCCLSSKVLDSIQL